MNALIELRNVSKNYRIDANNFESVLEDINLQVREGEFLMIKGPSGGGKTTIANIISGLDTDYMGEVYFKNQKITGIKNSRLTKYRGQNIGFVFQTFNLIPHLSVVENVTLPMKLLNPYNAQKEALQLLEKVDMAQFAKKNVTKLSGGQKQRVAIARALANNPDLIIADEPTGSLDSASQEMIMMILKQLSEQGKTIILITHNEEILHYADRVVLVKDGKVESQTDEK